jgi:hypothetical protein
MMFIRKLGKSLVLATALMAVPAVRAAPVSPVYLHTFGDAVTGDNQFSLSGELYWDVDPGADVYQVDVYERPMIQTFTLLGNGRYASKEYFEYLDITQGKIGWDNQYLYVSIDLFGRDIRKTGTTDEKGLNEIYGFRISDDPNGRNGYLFQTVQPESKHGTTYGLEANRGFKDTDGDVGGAGLKNGSMISGLTVTKQDNLLEDGGTLNGFDTTLIADGKLGGTNVFWSRVSPTDDTIVEMAVDYVALGLTISYLETLAYFDAEAFKGGPNDNQKYLWNDKYTKSEAGSPNPGMGGLSEFGTQGLGDLYELDTLRSNGIPQIPPPDPDPTPEIPSPAASSFALGLIAMMAMRRR